MTDRKWSKRPGYLARYALTKGIQSATRAEELRAKRIASLQKQIKALQDKRFTVSEVDL